MSCRFQMVVVLVCVALCAGCNHDEKDDMTILADVRGTVTFCGAPANAEVIFEPQSDREFKSGRPSSAVTDANGEFFLYQTSDQAGTTPGKHRVAIKVYGIAGRDLTTAAAGTALMSTRLVREVKPGRNRFDFVLTF